MTSPFPKFYWRSNSTHEPHQVRGLLITAQIGAYLFSRKRSSDKMATIGKTISNPIHDNLYGPRSDKRDLVAANSILITYESP